MLFFVHNLARSAKFGLPFQRIDKNCVVFDRNVLERMEFDLLL